MRKKWFFLGCLTSLAIVILFFVGLGFGVAKLVRTPLAKVQTESYLRIKLEGSIPEYIEIRDEYFSSMPKVSVNEIITKIRHASVDENIKGIILEPKYVAIGWSSLFEIMNALENFKNSGKEVIAYLELASNKDYFISSIANRIYLNPSKSAGIFLDGIGGNFLYFKEFFDSIGVDFEIFHAGDYKGAGENFSRTEMSDELFLSINELFSDFYDNMTSIISLNRGLTESEILDIYENRDMILISGNKAIDYNLVDALSQKDMIYSKYDINQSRILNIGKYKVPYTRSYGHKIAVVYMQGNITPVRSPMGGTTISADKFRKIFETIKTNDSIKAVVLRVDSPGGSALESDMIYEMIEKLNYIKPVVVSMANIAASGGYYISAPAEFIYADPFTITGSIGVVGMIPNLSGLGEKLGIRSHEIEYGKFSNLFNPWKPFDEDEKKAFNTNLNAIYDEFKYRVSTARNLDQSEVDSAAQGRIWGSRNALNHKLIDEVGSFYDAVRKAQQLADIIHYDLVYYPAQRSLFEYFLEERFDFSVLSGMFFSEQLQEILDTFEFGVIDEFRREPVQKIVPIQFD